MDLDGSELNHFDAAFFSVIENALHLTGSKAPVRAILGLKASMFPKDLCSHHKAPCWLEV